MTPLSVRFDQLRCDLPVFIQPDERDGLEYRGPARVVNWDRHQESVGIVYPDQKHDDIAAGAAYFVPANWVFFPDPLIREEETLADLGVGGTQ